MLVQEMNGYLDDLRPVGSKIQAVFFEPVVPMTTIFETITATAPVTMDHEWVTVTVAAKPKMSS